MNKGITYMETIIAAGLLAVIGGALISFLIFMGAWPAQEEARFQIQLALDRSAERMVRDLRETKEVSCPDNEEIRFGDPNTNLYFIYYFSYKEDNESYHLKKTNLYNDANDIDLKSFDNTSGEFLAANIIPPDSLFEVEGNGVVSIRLVIQKGDDKMRINAKAKPRNL